MKNLVLALAVFFTANIFANAPFFIKDIVKKSIVLNLSNWKNSKISITIKNDDGNIVFSESIEKPNSSRQYDLSKMADGDYTFYVENKQKCASQKINIDKANFSFSTTIDEIFKPIFIIKDNMWAIQALKLEKNAEVKIFDEEGNLVYSEKILKPVVEKKYNVTKLTRGNYEIQYSINDQLFFHSAFKK